MPTQPITLPARRPVRPREEAVYLSTLKCQVIKVFGGRALVKFSNSIDRVVPLETLSRPGETPRRHM